MKIYAGNIPFEFMAKTTKMCRLSLIRPFVFSCEDEDLILTKDIIDNIIIGLNSKPKLISLDGKRYNTVWESLISDINYIHHDNLNEDIDKDFIVKDIPMNLPIPDYYQLSNIKELNIKMNKILEDSSYSAPEYFDDKILIEATPHFNKEYDPYFRLYSGRPPFNIWTSTDTKMCRISLLHPNTIGLDDEDLILTEDIVDILIRALSEKPKYENTLNHYANTVWESIIEDLNNIHKDYDEDMGIIVDEIPINLPIPDYYQLLK